MCYAVLTHWKYQSYANYVYKQSQGFFSETENPDI